MYLTLKVSLCMKPIYEVRSLYTAFHLFHRNSLQYDIPLHLFILSSNSLETLAENLKTRSHKQTAGLLIRENLAMG